MSQGLLFDDLTSGPEPLAPKRQKGWDVEWPLKVFSIECQLPACVVRFFPRLAAELRNAIRSGEDWYTFLDVVYSDHDERLPAVERDVQKGLAKIGAIVSPRALKPALAEEDA
jgi:hypothetical protein